MLNDLQIQRMKQREIVFCSHLLDFCTRHLVIQDKSEFISDTSRPILSYHLVPPRVTGRYFGLSLKCVGGREGVKRFAHATIQTPILSAKTDVVGAERLTRFRNLWMTPNTEHLFLDERSWSVGARHTVVRCYLLGLTHNSA